MIRACSVVITIPSTPRSTLFPYTTLFRSQGILGARVDPDGACNLCFAAPFRIEWCFHMLYLVLMHRTTNMTRTLTNRSEEHTSELQSRRDLVCRLLLEKKKI